MVKIGLQFKATFENIEELSAADPDFSWCMKFTCWNCAQETAKWYDVSLSEEIEEPHGKSISHFVLKCKECLRVNSISILPETIKPYTSKNEGKFETIVIFDCRGMEPINFWPKSGWTAKATDDGDTFTDVDLTEGEWVDFDMKNKRPVGITEIQHKFERIKPH